MDWSSWFRRSDSKPNSQNQSKQTNKQREQVEEQGEFLGITNQLIDHVKSFTIDTFKNFPLTDEEEGIRGATFSDETTTVEVKTSASVRKDLSLWQEQHATLVLSKVKELSQLRFKLCPRHLKERDFWRIYFTLVKSYIAEYELQAIRQAKLNSMVMENEKSSDSSTIEVEMAETKQPRSSEPPTP